MRTYPNINVPDYSWVAGGAWYYKNIGVKQYHYTLTSNEYLLQMPDTLTSTEDPLHPTSMLIITMRKDDASKDTASTQFEVDSGNFKTSYTFPILQFSDAIPGFRRLTLNFTIQLENVYAAYMDVRATGISNDLAWLQEVGVHPVVWGLTDVPKEYVAGQTSKKYVRTYDEDGKPIWEVFNGGNVSNVWPKPHLWLNGLSTVSVGPPVETPEQPYDFAFIFTQNDADGSTSLSEITWPYTNSTLSPCIVYSWYIYSGVTSEMALLQYTGGVFGYIDDVNIPISSIAEVPINTNENISTG